jgi:hypothetical protein
MYRQDTKDVLRVLSIPAEPHWYLPLIGVIPFTNLVVDSSRCFELE